MSATSAQYAAAAVVVSTIGFVALVLGVAFALVLLRRAVRRLAR